MKNKHLLSASALLLVSATLFSCGGAANDGGTQRKGTISMWVGQESVDFYKEVANEFLEKNPSFEYNISIVGADTGSAAGALIQDNTACADIVTIAHDNIGKLSQKSLILPIVDEGLLTQINNDNPETFKSVIKNKYGAGAEAKEYTFAVPYISQALFLYYNKKFVTPEQAQTFEGLEEAAKAANKKAFTVTGTDSFNFSFTELAVRNKDKYTSVKIYEDFKMANCFVQGNDTIAVTRWAQEEFNKDNGGTFPSSSGWEVDLNQKNPKIISLIGGAWHFNAVKSALGEENMGCALIPTFTLKENHVEGLTANELDPNVPKAGDVYRGGTFADCKCFVINTASKVEKTKSMTEIIKYFSSKEIQNRSLLEAGNVPAHKDALSFVEEHKSDLSDAAYQMSKSQIEMAEYGRPQPFRTGILNTYFYSKGCDTVLKNTIVNEKGAYNDVQKIREQLYKIEHTWTKGGAPLDKDIPTELPAKMPDKK